MLNKKAPDHDPALERHMGRWPGAGPTTTLYEMAGPAVDRICAPPAPADPTPQAAQLLEAAADGLDAHWPDEAAHQDALITWIVKAAHATPGLTPGQSDAATRQATAAAPTIPPGATRREYAASLRTAAQQLRDGGEPGE